MNARITAVSSTRNLAVVRSLGADQVVDYNATSLSTLDEPFDVVFDAVGKMTKSIGKAKLRPGGRYVSTRERTTFAVQDLQFIGALIEDGKLTPVIDRVYTLDKIVEAHAYVEQFRKRGNVAIQVMNE
jgi:NADPH:quinone reductase-like Zn-dependent oxidoreductase